MFASHLLGSVINGIRPVSNAQQPIELEPGQVFRGVIVKAFPNQMVQVQLAGTTLYAQLNAPLEVGQQAWLQVLPKNNPITLQVIDTPRAYTGTTMASTETTPKSALEGLLRGLGIKADRTNIQNLKLIFDAGIPLKTEKIGNMLDLLRSSSGPDRTLQLLQLAHQRGLPITNEVIRSLEATLFGRSLGDIMNQLSQQMSETRQATPLIQHANQIWQEARAALTNMIGGTKSSNTITGQQNTFSPIQQTQVQAQTPTLMMPSVDSNSADPSTRTLASSQTLPIQSENPELSSNNSRSLVDVASEQRIQAPQENGLTKFFRLLGVDYEQTLLSRGTLQADAVSIIKPELLQQLKAVLLELKGMEQLSTSLRDTIDQGIRMITGQQLLMVNDGNTPWNSFIFQIPLPHMQNAEPSFIHIEGRKKGKEAIDHENCRLLFHLDLDALDQTIIDIQITNRIMSIQIYNDAPWLKAWIDEHREEWIAAMQEQVYYLSSIKVQAVPQQPKQVSNSTIPVPQSSYRGVDLRV